MLFSSPDYPLYLLAVFLLYALSRWGRPGETATILARIGVMVLLADVVMVLVSKDPRTLWDPVGGLLLGVATLDERYMDLSFAVVARWVIGSAMFAGAFWLGRRHAAWIASERGQALIARGLVVAISAIGITVLVGYLDGSLALISREISGYGHLLLLAVLGVAIGVSLDADHRPLGRVIILFVASTLFYQAWASSQRGAYCYLLALLLGTITLDYYLGIWIEATETPWKRRALLVLSLVSNLGILVFFKYSDFFTHDVFGSDSERLNLILPAGISFHTFQSLSYTVDVYRKELKATRSVVSFATFVLFFPQLVAGPIVRAQDLLPQLENPPALDYDKAAVGLYRIAIGLFKKIAIADTLALSIVDRVFKDPGTFSSIEVAAGVVGFALQIFCDFSAYSDIAIGSAAVLGFKMPENFRTPYRSANIQEFWRRWHISLSTWLRDYLYVTLGGNRKGPAMTYVNLTLTMLLGGLWHGASWPYVVWGALHGFGLAVTRFFQRASVATPEAGIRRLAYCGMFALAGYACVRFAVPDDAAGWKVAVGWSCVVPLWALLTATLGRDEPAPPGPPPPIMPFPAVLFDARARTPELLRQAMCVCAVGFFLALKYAPTWTWIPLIVATWALGVVADIVEGTLPMKPAALAAIGRRAIAITLVFAYVCFAWIFFRPLPYTMDDALVVITQLGKLEFDHANIVPLVTVPLVAGFASHFFADGGYRWLRERFVALPAIWQGAVLALVCVALRPLSHHEVVQFIYFQF